MVALPQVYQTSDLPDTGGPSPLIPPGQYPAVIVASELKQNSKNTGSFLALTVIITQGQYQGTEFIERLNIINQSSEAVNVAFKTLARISEAVGMTQTPKDSSELHNKPFFIQIETEDGKEYTDNQGVKKQGKDKSIIKKYMAQPTGLNGAPTPNAANAPAPTANPFAPKSA